MKEKIKSDNVRTNQALAISPSNYGYIKTSLPKQLLKSLKKECSVVEKGNRFITGLTESYPYTSNHYEITDESRESLFKFVRELIEIYEHNFDYIGSIKVLDKSIPYVFGQPWINVQKNYQYIPVHVHDGVYSYTCWIDLPPNSLFEFLYPSVVGTPIREAIELTPEDEGDFIFFPAGLQHTVHPFEGDNKRISISGNILLGTE